MTITSTHSHFRPEIKHHCGIDIYTSDDSGDLRIVVLIIIFWLFSVPLQPTDNGLFSSTTNQLYDMEG